MADLSLTLPPARDAARGTRALYGPVGAYAGFAVLGFLLLAGGLAATAALTPGPASPGAAGAALAAYAAVSAVTGALLARHFPHGALGWCNVVTQARLALAALLAAALMAGQSGGWAVAGIAVAALALDGVDGWLARRQGLASAFGARFDMEVDSALALLLALHALASAAAGPVVLVLGLARYAFAAAGLIWPWLARPLPERLSRKAVCVAQLGVLIALQVPPMPAALATGLTVAVAGALAWSFGRDAGWLHGRRAA